MLAFQDLADWYANLVAGDYWPGGEVPDVNAPYVMLTEVPGPGLSTDGAMDRQAWQLRCAGPQGADDRVSYANSQEFAFDLDRAVATAGWPLTIGATRVQSAYRLGPAPRMLLKFDDETIHFTVVHLFEVPSGY